MHLSNGQILEEEEQNQTINHEKLEYTQYLIIRNSTEFLGKFKKRIKELKKRSVLRFSKLRNE